MSPLSPSAALIQWLERIAPEFHLALSTLELANADAGARQYWRIQTTEGTSLIIMDAQKDKASAFSQFLKIDALFRDEAHLNAPEIYSVDSTAQFMLLSDMGKQTYLSVLNEDNAAQFMDKATDALVAWQLISRPNVLPEYDEATLRRELELFPTWYVERHCGVNWNEQQQRWWEMSTHSILEACLAQPKVFVHRDFMPRNLMVTTPMPGILDFQDALYGPITYDIASLLKDAFISWGESFVLDITIRYWEKARKAGLPVNADFGAFYRDVDFMSVQRHLKVLGIFARLHYRDGKSHYLEDTPRFIEYVKKTSQRYSVLSPLARLINELTGTEVKVGYTF